MSPINPPHERRGRRTERVELRELSRGRGPGPGPGPDRHPRLDSEPAARPRLDPPAELSRSDARRPDDVLLADRGLRQSLAKDRGRKARLYAEAGIADYWIVNIPERCVEVRRDPEGDAIGS